mmetsp:Transcript_79798/g.182817  ORF Transcript_79798/g.182817 Transcript_79798/m.182817 type:complete len:194 (+) Transcript_79798:63-644(+)
MQMTAGRSAAVQQWRSGAMGTGGGGRSVPAFQQPARPALSEDQHDELREAFNLFDTEHSGMVDARELKAAMLAVGFDVPKPKISNMLRTMGLNDHSQVRYEQFAEMMAVRMPEKESREEIHRIFQLFDEDGTGKLNFRNLKRVALEIGETLTDEDLRDMVDETDRDGDGLIGPEEFYLVMRRKDPGEPDSDEG